MNRDELILSCQDIVKNLVKKYNNHVVDEDMVSVGMIAVIECVDRCLKENMTDSNQIQARCNVWARNRILTEIYKEKIKVVYDEEYLDSVEAPENTIELMLAVRNELTPKQLEVFDLRLSGYNQQEIMDKLGIEKAMYFRHLQNIKEKIKSLQ